jgi:hypothetical protein
MAYKLAPPGSFNAQTQDMTKLLHAHDSPLQIDNVVKVITSGFQSCLFLHHGARHSKAR